MWISRVYCSKVWIMFSLPWKFEIFWSKSMNLPKKKSHYLLRNAKFKRQKKCPGKHTYFYDSSVTLHIQMYEVLSILEAPLRPSMNFMRIKIEHCAFVIFTDMNVCIWGQYHTFWYISSSKLDKIDYFIHIESLH